MRDNGKLPDERPAATGGPGGSDLLHPWRWITGALHGGRLAAGTRRFVSRRLYEYLGRKYPTAEWTTMNYGFHDPALADPQPGADRPEQLALNLYQYVATMGDDPGGLDGRDVLEVGSGRGGGAAYLAGQMTTGSYCALDVSASATHMAATRYAEVAGLQYRQGDAENLAFAEASFDTVLNIESAHCYGSLQGFLAEVRRVLRPGGELRFADFVSSRGGAQQRLQETLSGCGLATIYSRDITSNVVEALVLDEARKRALLERWVRGPFATFARGAYAMEGSAMRRELASGQTRYLAVLLRKPATQG